MKHIIFILLACSIQLFAVNFSLKSQVKNVIVEKYYISDANDAKDTTAGTLEEGSLTYRIFVDLAEGTVLKKIYGDVNHALKFSSTALFFNNTDRGTSFGKDINDSKINQNTLALDSWITLGMATKKHMGILKSEDNDGTIVSGSSRTDGLLKNANTAAGIPLTQADGLIPAITFPTSWSSYGFVNSNATEDSTIFGEFKEGNQFISNNCGLQNSGLTDLNTDNKILVAQLTTNGEISFEINIEVEENDGSGIRTVRYVANGEKLLAGEILCPYLKYPQDCGCKDPKYLEYRSSFACENSESCKTLIVLGCTDPMACNYDPKANFNIQNLCCYPGNCNDRDISLVCPILGKNETKVQIHPNPVNEKLEINISSGTTDEAKLIIYDYVGRVILEKNIGTVSDNTLHIEDVSNFRNGIYFLRLFRNDSSSDTKIFIKN